MPRAPNVKKSEAEKLFQKGMKLAEIAKKLDVPEGTVRSWKNRGKWAEKSRKKSQCNVAVNETETNATLQKKKRGGQPGNQNAKGSKGGGAPLRNHNAEKHGAHSKIYWDALDDEALALIYSMNDDEEWHLITQLQMFSLRERDLMHKLKRYNEVDEKSHGLAVKAVSKKKVVEDVVNSQGEPIGDGNFKKSSETTVTNTEAVINSIIALEAELTKIQRAKTRAIESLSKLRLERGRLKIEDAKEHREANLHGLRKEMLDAQIEHMDASTNKLLGADVELEDTSDTDAMIYGDGSVGGSANEE